MLACLFLPSAFGGCEMLNRLLGSLKTGSLPCALPAAREGTWGSPLSLSRLLLGQSQVWTWGKSLACHHNAGSSFAVGESGATMWHQRKVTIKQRDVYVCLHLNSSLSLLVLVNKLLVFLEEVIFCHCTFKCQAPGEESSR